MSYQVLARKWRPRSFAQLVGQEHVVRALVNALDQNRIHHAFLFTGTRGVGKTTIARVFAKALNCESGVSSEPCGECGSCKDIDEGRFLDLIEVDAASRTKVEDTRDLMENVQYSPARGRYKVYLIDEVHMLSTHSFNALLKTLEEPPPHVKFLLATTNPQKLPVTILSRCLQFNLKRLAPPLITEYLGRMLHQETVEFEAEALQLVAMAADGSMRDALSLIDQGIAYGAGRLLTADVRSMLGTVERRHLADLVAAICAGEAQALWQSIEALEAYVPDFSRILGEVAQMLHQAAVVQLVDGGVADDAQVNALASDLSPEDVQLFYQIAVAGRSDLDLAPDHRTGFEMTMLRMLAFRPAASVPPAALAPAGERAPQLSAADSGAADKDPPGKDAAQSRGPARLRAVAAVAASEKPMLATPAVSAPADHTQSAGIAEPGPQQLAGASAASQWGQLISQLGLNGTAAVLAENSVFRREEEGRFALVLDPKLEHLRTPAAEEKIASALVRFYGKEVQVRFTREQAQEESPALAQARETDTRLKRASAALEDDPAVRTLRREFGAELLADSIMPVEE